MVYIITEGSINILVENFTSHIVRIRLYKFVQMVLFPILNFVMELCPYNKFKVHDTVEYII